MRERDDFIAECEKLRDRLSAVQQDMDTILSRLKQTQDAMLTYMGTYDSTEKSKHQEAHQVHRRR